MKFGVREICNVVMKTKSARKIGTKQFYKNEPVLYFDTLKTSTLEAAVTTVYATGGRGNSRLVAWDGERTVTFTMEDALISAESFSILAGAGLIDAKEKGQGIHTHITETIDVNDTLTLVKASGSTEATVQQRVVRDSQTGAITAFYLSAKPYIPATANKGADGTSYAFMMLVKDGDIISEPYLPTPKDDWTETTPTTPGADMVTDVNTGKNYYKVLLGNYSTGGIITPSGDTNGYSVVTVADVAKCDSIIVDYYDTRYAGVKQINITPDMIGGNFYLEAETLFRTQDGRDLPAIFTIPNCKIQSNFTFSMAASGDPSTFSFVVDAFPDFTRFDRSQKVLASIDIIEESAEADKFRSQTDANGIVDYEG